VSERIHKILAQHGIGSRREAERWIAEGRIQINGVIAKTGDRYVDGDKVLLDGRDVSRRLQRTHVAQVLAYHKPQGQPIERPAANQLAARSAEHAEEVIAESAEERLPVQRGSRWVAINPMHPGDSGLVLFTNDGALSYALTRQKKKIPTTYMVRVQVRGGVAAAPVLPSTLKLDDETIHFTEVSVSSGAPEGESESGNIWYKVMLPRADKRAAVRALFVSHSLVVSRMMQVAFGDIKLTKELPRGRHAPLKPKQMEQLYALAQLSVPRATQTDSELERDEKKPKSRAAKPPEFTAQEMRRATRAKRPATHNAATAPTSPDKRPPQRSALRRGSGGGSNRPSRPGSRPGARKSR